MADHDEKPICKYGEKCYQRNEAHRNRFRHPQKDSEISNGKNQTAKREISRSPSPSSNSKRVRSSSSDSSNGSNDSKEDSNQDSETSQAKANEKDDESSMEQSTSGAHPKIEYITDKYDNGPHGQKIEYQKLLENPNDFIRNKFLVEMPSDFFTFWDFCQSKNKDSPEKLFEKFGLNLVGPFDVLAKKFNIDESFEPGEYLRHWRFFYDPPEFQVTKFYRICG